MASTWNQKKSSRTSWSTGRRDSRMIVKFGRWIVFTVTSESKEYHQKRSTNQASRPKTNTGLDPPCIWSCWGWRWAVWCGVVSHGEVQLTESQCEEKLQTCGHPQRQTGIQNQAWTDTNDTQVIAAVPFPSARPTPRCCKAFTSCKLCFKRWSNCALFPNRFKTASEATSPAWLRESVCHRLLVSGRYV